MTERLYRHPTDRAIAGVAGGLAAWLDVDPSLVRIAWVLLAIFTGGIFVLVYIVMMIVVPLPPPGWTPRPRDWRGPGPGSVPGWQPGSPYWQPGGSSWAPGGGPAGTWGTAPDASAGQAAPGSAPGTDPVSWTAPGAAPGGWTAPDGSTVPPQWGTPPPGGWPGSASTWGAPRRGTAGIVVGSVLVLLGVWFLIDQFVHVNWDLLWPVVIMILGGALIAAAVTRGRSSS